jgi:hypothetical protein
MPKRTFPPTSKSSIFAALVLSRILKFILTIARVFYAQNTLCVWLHAHKLRHIHFMRFSFMSRYTHMSENLIFHTALFFAFYQIQLYPRFINVAKWYSLAMHKAPNESERAERHVYDTLKLQFFSIFHSALSCSIFEHFLDTFNFHWHDISLSQYCHHKTSSLSHSTFYRILSYSSALVHINLDIERPIDMGKLWDAKMILELGEASCRSAN